MTALFLRLVNLAIAAGWLVLAVLVLRLLLRRAPKWSRCILWALAAARLLLPFSIESALSLIPSAETIPQEIALAEVPAIHSGVFALNATVNPVLAEHFAPALGDSANPLQVWLPVLAAVWLAGTIGMLLYALLSYLRLKRRVAVSLPLEEGVYLCDGIPSPFLLGVFRPRIYLPSDLDETRRADVLRHERAHLARRDHWWKPLGFLLLSVYWFHPLLWLGYVLFCRDIELACDERVVREMEEEAQADYAQTLLDLSRARPAVAACPLAFGEVGVKQRVKAALSYQKPAFWIVAAAVLVCAVTAVCFLTSPVQIDPDSIESAAIVGGPELPREAAEELISAINTHRRTWHEIGAEQTTPNSRQVKLNRSDGSFYLLIYRYCSGYSFHPLHFGDDDYESILTLFDTNGKPKRAWRMAYEFDEAFYDWYAKYEAVVTESSPITTGAVPPSNALIVRYDSEALTQEDLDALGQKYGFTAVRNFGRSDLFSAYYDEPLTDQSMNEQIEALLQEPHIRDVTPGEIPERTEAELREQCPEYFDLSAFKGLEVYVWQMVPHSYSCGVMIGTNRNKTNEEIWNLHRNPVSIGEMRTILASSDITRENIIIIPVHMPFSSYAYTIDDAYLENLRTLFWR